MRIRYVAILGLACASLVCGCSSGSSASNTNIRQVLTDKDLAQYSASSPAYALLAWWRAIQYDDLAGYLSGYNSALQAQRKASGLGARELPLLSSQLQTQRPMILYTVQSRPDFATIFTLVYARAPLGKTAYVGLSSPHAFAMVRERGQWRLAEDAFVTAVLAVGHETLTSNTTPVRVPDVRGERLGTAQAVLLGSRLIGRVSAGPSGGRVIKQSAAPGSQTAPGSSVRLTLAP